MSAREAAEAAIAYLHSADWRNCPPGLGRMRRLLEALGNPQAGMKFVHVAGTNGKGSTCAMVASVLRQAGYRVGLNVSPYVLCFHERVQVNGEMISDEELAALVEELRPAVEAMEEKPTEFERITALALLHFRRRHCDIAVLEVGMGGALDASNVIDCPEVAVITAMGMDHVKELGPTLSDIAAAKAGIVKAGGTIVSYGDCVEADEVIRRVCREQGATLREAAFSRLEDCVFSPEGSRFDCRPYGRLRLSLAGGYQPRNAVVAVTALEVLRERGWHISDEAIRRGLECVAWPGRFELLRRGPDVLLDGAHNPQGMAAAAESLGLCYPGRRVIFLLGLLADKDAGRMLAEIGPLAEGFVLIPPISERAKDSATLARELEPWGRPIYCREDADAGVRTALELAGETGVVCALGSLYLSGPVRRAVENLN